MNKLTANSVKTAAFAVLFGMISMGATNQADAQWNPVKQIKDAARRAENSVRTEAGRLSDSVKRAHRLNYAIKIEFESPNRSGIHYKIDGKPFLLYPKKFYKHKRTQVGKPVVTFDNGRNQSIRYSLSSGNYVFRWKNGVLNLYRK